MNRHTLAQSILPGLLASGHFTQAPDGNEGPWFVIDAVFNTATKKTILTIPAITAAYALADKMIEEASK